MRVLVCHVRYREAGGEDAVFENEVGILRRAGLEVSTLALSSAELGKLSPRERLSIAWSYADHRYGRRLINSEIGESRPDVVHFHNIYPYLGPGAIAEAKALGCATVQTIHNHRLSCLAGTHLRGTRICRACRPGYYWPGVVRGCYRHSTLQSYLTSKAAVRQWRQFVDHGAPTLWLSLTEHARDYWVSLGAPSERVLVKPNSVASGTAAGGQQVPDKVHSGTTAGKAAVSIEADGRRSGAFCGGRLSPEKGFSGLIAAWPPDAPPLSIAGGGPLEARLRAEADKRDNVTCLGHLPHDQMLAHMRRAKVVVMPSICPEPLGLVTLEALGQATPVLSFDGTSLGSVLEEIDPRCTVPYGDFGALAQRATELVSKESGWTELSRKSRTRWEMRYSNDVNEKALVGAYRLAMQLANSSS